MNTRIVYCDETGDDGLNTSSSEVFILTSIYMPSNSWNDNYETIKRFRKSLRSEYGFHVGQEMHTKHFLSDKNPYRSYQWTPEQKRDILKQYTLMISSLNLVSVNVIIDKTRISTSDYSVLENALTYNIQRIENDSNGEWNYLLITDKGRLPPMRKTARAIRSFNPIHSQFGGYINKPIKGMIEDVLEKDSSESHYIQICDFISYFVHLYYLTRYKNKSLPNRVGRLIDADFVGRVMATLSKNDIFNKKASKEKYGLVIYPRN